MHEGGAAEPTDAREREIAQVGRGLRRSGRDRGAVRGRIERDHIGLWGRVLEGPVEVRGDVIGVRPLADQIEASASRTGSGASSSPTRSLVRPEGVGRGLCRPRATP